jgi:hypothetical protein
VSRDQVLGLMALQPCRPLAPAAVRLPAGRVAVGLGRLTGPSTAPALPATLARLSRALTVLPLRSQGPASGRWTRNRGGLKTGGGTAQMSWLPAAVAETDMLLPYARDIYGSLRSQIMEG